jgi:hypothetical protein
VAKPGRKEENPERRTKKGEKCEKEKEKRKTGGGAT